MEYLLLDSQNYLEPVGMISTEELCQELNIEPRQLPNFINKNKLYQGQYYLVEDEFIDLGYGGFQQSLFDEDDSFLYYLTKKGEIYKQEKENGVKTSIPLHKNNGIPFVKIKRKTYNVLELFRLLYKDLETPENLLV